MGFEKPRFVLLEDRSLPGAPKNANTLHFEYSMRKLREALAERLQISLSPNIAVARKPTEEAQKNGAVAAVQSVRGELDHFMASLDREAAGWKPGPVLPVEESPKRKKSA
jgi:hypothetical protein